MPFANQSLFPITADVNESGRLELGGCDAVDLAAEFGTPLYVYDEKTLRRMCRDFVTEFASRYDDSLVAYASKAFLNPAIGRLAMEEGLGLDVVSGGELALGRAIEFPADRIYFHGNNKTPSELALALDYGVGRVVVDSFHELQMLNGLAGSHGAVQDVMLRLSPGRGPTYARPHHNGHSGQ